MNGQFNIRILLVVLAMLSLTKFFIVPLTAWQNEAISILKIEKSQLLKMQRLVGSVEEVNNANDAFADRLADLKASLFDDSESLKLDAQSEILEVISSSDLAVRSFVWVFDRDGPYRTLRAKISYTGSFADAIQLQWDLAASPRLFRVVESRHIVKPKGEDFFGAVEVFLTIELYAMGSSFGDEID
jgi:hypothetical protein